MPVFRRLEAHDPKHGSVGDLCRNLGYGSDGKGTPRSKYFLSSKVAVYRKDFLETYEGIDLFPLEYWSTASRRCASNFLHQNVHLFQDSGEARVFHYPIYPQDEERLLEDLAKLMCTQEFVHRRNANSAESAREKRAREEKEDSVQDEDKSDSEHSEFARPPSSPASSISSFHEDQDAITRDHTEQVQGNIEIHLDFIYPLDSTIRASSPRFLYDNSGKWPQDAKRFAWRYLHERNLYHARKTNAEAVIQFAANLIRWHGVAYTEERVALVQRRCGRQITYHASLWCGYGFLEELDNGGFKKTAEFEALWRDRRKKWIDLVHNGNPSGVIELETTLSVSGAAENGTGRKRSLLQTGPVCDMLFHDTSTGPAAKRSRGNLFEGPFSSSRNGSEEDQNFDTGHDHETISVEVEGAREARRAPVASMVTPLADRPQRSARAVPVELEQICNIPKQLSPAVMNSSSMTQAPASLQSDHSSAPSNATLDETEDTPPMLEKRTSPYALFGSSLNLPFDADTALVKSTPKLAADKAPEKPTLHYILPCFSGGLDHKNDLPRETWRACNISQFFDVVASRAGRPQGSLSCLTLTYNWGEVESFVVHRFEGDQYWEEIKQRVKAQFRKARNSFKKKTTSFELWVQCGDTTNLDDDQDDDDC